VKVAFFMGHGDQPPVAVSGRNFGYEDSRGFLSRSVSSPRREGNDARQSCNSIEATAVPLRELTITPTAFVGELALRESASADRRHVPPSKYFPKLHGALEEVERTTTALMSILETYAIVNPEFATFRSRLGECLRHATVAVNDFRELAWQFAGSENLSVIRWPPTDKESKTLSRLASSAESSARSLKTTVSDLCVTAQNYHLGTLFADNTLKAATNSE
jgi:hypothetical protein